MQANGQARGIFVGRTISEILFEQDNVQIHFDYAIFTILTDPVVIVGQTEHKVRGATHCEMLVKQIGRKVVDESVVEGDVIHITLDDGTVIVVSLRSGDRITAEAATFTDENGQRWVW